jgi:hypothetical protein
MNNTNKKEINNIKLNINDCNIDMTTNKRKQIDEENENNILNDKLKFYDVELQQEITEIKGNSCSSNINVFNINKFTPFEKKQMMINLNMKKKSLTTNISNIMIIIIMNKVY